MKTTIKQYLTTVVLILGTFINYANENNTSFDIIDGKKVRFEFKQVKKGHILSIINENGLVMYRQEIKNTGTYSQIFDLSKLEKGKYTTELEKDYEITIRNLTILEGKVYLQDEKKLFKPVIRIEKNLVLISKITFYEEPIKIVFYYNEEIIYSETVTNVGNVLNSVYKLSKEKKGAYNVAINSNNRSYTKTFTL